MGTFHLANQVIESLFRNIEKAGMKLPFQNNSIDVESIKFTFKVAALLHDVGHSPFSHTGEFFFQVKKLDESIDNYAFIEKIKNAVKAKSLSYLDGLLINELAEYYNVQDINSESADEKPVQNFTHDFIKILRENSAKPHEKMSALIGLKYLKEEILSVAKTFDDKLVFNADLFVRSIIGAQYDETKDSKEKSFCNIIISLLNSDTIDVDKLDYIMRDAYMTGFKNVSIDVERLINSFTVVLENDKWFRLAYKKNSMSVIENVLSASDANNKWIVNHPVIVYDTYITKRCVCETFKIFAKDWSKGNEKEELSILSKLFESVFSMEALSLEGIKLYNGEYAFLLSDVDIKSFFKRAYNVSQDKNQKNLLDEFFARNKRRHPLWKSEMEFNSLFNKKKSQDVSRRIDNILDAVKEINEPVDKITNVPECFINERNYKEYTTENAEKFINAIRQYFINKKMNLNDDFDIVILDTFLGDSRLLKLNKNSLYVALPNIDSKPYCLFSEIAGVREAAPPSKMFYLYTKNRIDPKDFVQYLLYEAKI